MKKSTYFIAGLAVFALTAAYNLPGKNEPVSIADSIESNRDVGSVDLDIVATDHLAVGMIDHLIDRVTDSDTSNQKEDIGSVDHLADIVNGYVGRDDASHGLYDDNADDFEINKVADMCHVKPDVIDDADTDNFDAEIENQVVATLTDETCHRDDASNGVVSADTCDRDNSDLDIGRDLDDEAYATLIAETCHRGESDTNDVQLGEVGLALAGEDRSNTDDANLDVAGGEMLATVLYDDKDLDRA